MLYLGHHSWLVRWLHRKLGNVFDADDLAQDTYVRVAKAESVPAAEEARPYLAQVAKRLMIDLHRRRTVEKTYLTTLEALPGRFAPSQEEIAIALEMLTAIDTALSTVPPLAREVFFLANFEDCTHGAIAARLRIGESTVRKYLLAATKACFLQSRYAQAASGTTALTTAKTNRHALA